MNRLRLTIMRGAMFVLASLIAVALPAGGEIALAVAVAVLVHDGSSSSTIRWSAGWLILLEALSGTAFGTLALPFCLSALILMGVRRFVALTPWAERTGWALADGLRAVVTAVLLCACAWVFWVIVAVLSGAAAPVDRLVELLRGVPILIALSLISLLIARFSMEPLRRPIIFATS